MTLSTRLTSGLLAGILSLSGCSGQDPAPDRTDQARDPLAAILPADSLDALVLVAEELYASADYVRAGESLREALNAARALQARDREARILTWLGLAAWRLGDYVNARRFGETALSLKLELGLGDELFLSYNGLGLLAWNEARFSDADSLFGEALRTAEATADSASLAKVWVNRALLAMDRGSYSEARALLVEGHSLASALGDARTEGRALANLAAWEIHVGNPGVAIEVLKEARVLYRSVGDEMGELNALGQLGLASAQSGALGRGIAYLDSALMLARRLGVRQEEASNLEHLAELWGATGSFPRALADLAEAEAINRELGASLEVGADLRRAAEFQAAIGNLELATRLASEALLIHRELEARLEELDDLVMLAELAHRRDRDHSARAYLDEARRLAESVGTRSARLAVAHAQARMQEQQGDAVGVLRTLRTSAPDVAAAGSLAEWEASALMARAYDRLGMTDSAIAAGRRAVAAVERVRSRLGAASLRASYLADRTSAYGALVDLLLRNGSVDEAFEVSDAARGRELLELGVVSASGVTRLRPGTASLAEGERNLRRIDELVAQLDALDEVSPSRRGAEHAGLVERLSLELEQARSTYEESLVRARERDPFGLALLGADRPAVTDIRTSLRPDEALVEYFVHPERLLIFLVRSEGVTSHSIEIESRELASRIRVAREAILRSRIRPEHVQTVLAGLHEILIAPVAREGGLRGVVRLFIVPHRELTYLPFAALRDSHAGRFLAEDYQVTHLASAASLPALRSAPELRGQEALSAAVFAPFPSNLPATAREAEELRRVIPSAVSFSADSASEPAFRRTLEEGRIVHVATHGILNARNPMFSRLELREGRPSGTRPQLGPERFFADGRFEVHELLEASVRSPLVFLSGCDTGMGSGFATGFSRGADYATLAQAFLYAGAANVIATLWRIDDEGSAAFAARFYEELRRSSPGESLVRAQRAMVSDPRFGTPYYWAAFRLSGSGELRESPTP